MKKFADKSDIPAHVDLFEVTDGSMIPLDVKRTSYVSSSYVRCFAVVMVVDMGIHPAQVADFYGFSRTSVISWANKYRADPDTWRNDALSHVLESNPERFKRHFNNKWIYIPPPPTDIGNRNISKAESRRNRKRERNLRHAEP